MSTEDMRRAVAAICLTVFGSMFLAIAGLWPETTPAVVICTLVGWTAVGLAYRQYAAIGRDQ